MYTYAGRARAAKLPRPQGARGSARLLPTCYEITNSGSALHSKRVTVLMRPPDLHDLPHTEGVLQPPHCSLSPDPVLTLLQYISQMDLPPNTRLRLPACMPQADNTEVVLAAPPQPAARSYASQVGTHRGLLDIGSSALIEEVPHAGLAAALQDTKAGCSRICQRA